MLTKYRSWAGPDGLPTVHAIQSAMQVALIAGQHGSLESEVHESYWKRSGGGEFGPVDLRIGEELLVDTGLMEREGAVLMPLLDLDMLLGGDEADAIAVLCARTLVSLHIVEGPSSRLAELVPDGMRRGRILRRIARRFDDAQRVLVGQVGEEVVVGAYRRSLRSLGHMDLTRRVRQVSLEDDGAGYDVFAPRVSGSGWMIEVKSTTSEPDPIVFHLTRNEAEVGLREPLWAVVMCVGVDPDARLGEVMGWLPGSALGEYLPRDVSNGTWESALVTVSRSALVLGLPSVTL